LSSQIAKLYFERIDGAEPEGAIVFLHGILGRGINLQTLAKRFVGQRPGWAALLADLRGHGRSPKGGEGPSLEAAARDVIAQAHEHELPVKAIAGHSFGGKVALEAARIGEIATLRNVVVIDSMPGTREPLGGKDSALGILGSIESLPGTFASITEFVAAMERTGLTRPVAQWLAASLERTGDGLRFALDLHEIRALIADYFARDLWPVLEKPPGDVGVHLVIGDRSDSLTPADRTRARRIAESNPRVTVDVLPAGHWVHADDPEGLLRVMNRVLSRSN
jgi:esterase